MIITDLANKLGFTNDQLIELLLEEGINKTNPLDVLTDKEVKLIIDKYNERDIRIKDNNNKSSLKLINIKGLFNKYDFEFNLDKDVNILVAENGSGKTTILNIITAALDGDKNGIERLKKLPFNSITIKNYDNEEETINKDVLLDKKDYLVENEILLNKLRTVLPISIHRKLRIKLENMEYFDADEIIYYLKKYGYASEYAKEEIYMLINEIEFNKGRNRAVKHMKNIKKLIEQPIIYFPTYRRVEEELENIVSINSIESDNIKYAIKNNNKINFGITDVEMILTDLSNQLRDGAAEYYKKMTAEILEDLLCNRVHNKNMKRGNIDRKKIDIVIGRIGEDKINYIDKLKKFINGDLEIEYSNFLYYYINKLINLYELQKAIDNKIIKFKEVCNKYLLNKEVIYNEAMATVKVFDKETNYTIPWNKLSSGEKQIVSLFAKLYLNTTKPSIVIIDEPELSLSIFWQKTLLEDIYDSGKIALMIVTTHSPFIYKNRFSNFVKDLDLYKRRMEE